MATTLTKEEFECIKCQAIDKLRQAGFNLQRSFEMGLGSQDKDWSTIKKIFIYTNAIWQFENGEFTEIEYVNILTNYHIQHCLAKLRKLI